MEQSGPPANADSRVPTRLRGALIALLILASLGLAGFVGVERSKWLSEDRDAVQEQRQEELRRQGLLSDKVRQLQKLNEKLLQELEKKPQFVIEPQQFIDRASESLERAKKDREKHPERFQHFDPGDVVRILSGAPDEELRGLQGVVVLKLPEADEFTGLETAISYALIIPPLTQRGVKHVGRRAFIAADHLAFVGSARERQALRENRGLAIAAERQDGLIEDAARWEQELAQQAPFRAGDPILVQDSDPRPLLRGRRGEVLLVLSAKTEERDGLTIEWLPDCDVRLDSSREDPQIRFVQVNSADLAHPGR